jgi:carbonic anhydrase/acetyltransferase-like protein (isoleucine patch superfamily)
MLISHGGKKPFVDTSAWIAPNAVLCGAVMVGPGRRVMYGAQVIAEGGSITLGRECIIMGKRRLAQLRETSSADGRPLPGRPERPRRRQHH